jgi:vanillate O-demethylase ferredoxin subunit
MGLMLDPRRVKLTLDTRVTQVRREAEDIVSIELADAAGEALPPFEPGAHVDVHVAGGFLRQYSLCNDPAERHRYVIAVLREPNGRGGSATLYGIKPGEMLTVSYPRNHFPLAGREAQSHLLLAGGIGVTPMMAMVAALKARGAEYRMHYCTRSPERTAFLDRLGPDIEAGRVVLHHDGGDPSKGLDIAALLASYRLGTHLYYCGPASFMNGVKNATGAWPPHTVHFEYFTAPEHEAYDNAPFQIEIAGTGQLFDVPASESIVDVLRANDFSIDTDCREGYCGTCITRYLKGEPEHRDTVLSEKERKNYVMICCARAKVSPLVLDL